MRGLKRDVEENPLTNAIIIILLVIGLVSVPVKDIINLLGIEYTLLNELFFNGLFRGIYICILIKIIYSYNFNNTFRLPIKLYYVLPALIVVINNLPIVSLVTKEAEITGDAKQIIVFAFYCFCVGGFEELSFRNLVFPMCYIKLKNKKNGAFWSIVMSSALFGCVHMVNLLGGGNIVGVIMQIGYSFLIGAMCNICLIKTKSIFVSIFLHGLFNFNGQIIEYLGKGYIWNTLEIILTAVIGVIVGIIMLIIAIRVKKQEIEELFNL